MTSCNMGLDTLRHGSANDETLTMMTNTTKSELDKQQANKNLKLSSIKEVNESLTIPRSEVTENTKQTETDVDSDEEERLIN